MFCVGGMVAAEALDIPFDVAVPNIYPFRADGRLLPSPVTLSSIGLAMAERIEVIIDFSPYPIGSCIVLLNKRGNGSLGRIMRFDVAREERDDSRVPERLADFERLQPPQAMRTRTFVFGGRLTLGVPPGVKWLINSKPFDPARIDANPRLGDVEVWRFVNQAFMGRTMLHPVHTHLAPFQILRRNGRAPLRQEHGWKDTVAAEDGEEVDVIVRWTGYRGRYLLHLSQSRARGSQHDGTSGRDLRAS